MITFHFETMSKKQKTSSSDQKHPYLRPEKWVEELVFWNTAMHNQEAYRDFHLRMIEEAARQNRI